MNRVLRNLELRRDQNAALFMAEVKTAMEADLEGNCELVAEVDEKGFPKVPDGRIFMRRDDQWWSLKRSVLVEILDRTPEMPPDLKIVE